MGRSQVLESPGAESGPFAYRPESVALWKTRLSGGTAKAGGRKIIPKVTPEEQLAYPNFRPT